MATTILTRSIRHQKIIVKYCSDFPFTTHLHFASYITGDMQFMKILSAKKDAHSVYNECIILLFLVLTIQFPYIK